jgi:hypothetical protein
VLELHVADLRAGGGVAAAVVLGDVDDLLALDRVAVGKPSTLTALSEPVRSSRPSARRAAQ